MKIYVGCALAHASEEYKTSIAEFKTMLQQLPGVSVLDFVLDPNVTNEYVYKNDIEECVMNCDLLIADCTYPSIGLGYEIATMLEKRNQPVMAIAHKDAKVSRLIRGIPHANFSFMYYTTFHDVLVHIQAY